MIECFLLVALCPVANISCICCIFRTRTSSTISYKYTEM